MRKIKALSAVLFALCIMVLGGMETQAASVEGMQITSENTAVRKGDQMEVSFALSGYADIQTGVNAIKGTLNYDPEVFEEIQASDFQTLNTWESLFYNPANGQFVLVSRMGSTQQEPVMSLQLTAKQSIPAKETYISVTDVSVSEGVEDLLPTDQVLMLSSVSEQVSASQEQAFASQEQVSAASPSSGTSGVRTGDTAAGFLLLAGIALGAAVAACVVLAARKKARLSGRARLLTVLVACSAAVLLAAGGVHALTGKGDLNGDGRVDHTDVELLEKHLISLQELSSGFQSAADMNSDGNLTVTDLSLLMTQAGQNINYEVKLTSATEKFYYEKGEQAELKLSASVSEDAVIESMTVNGIEYPAEKAADSPVYTVRLGVGDEAGIRELRITGVRLDAGQTVDTDFTEKIEVLKTAPSVEGFLSEQINETGQMNVSFTLKDEDAALTGASVEVVKASEDSPLLTEEITAGQKEFVLDLEDGAAYTLYIRGSYNRSRDELGTTEDHTGSFLESRDLQLNLDYAFTFSGLRAGLEDGTPADEFGRNQPIFLTFETTNAIGLVPERAVVNGTSYPVEQTGSGYMVRLEGIDQIGSAQIRVEQIVLKNGKAFDLTDENMVQVNIQKIMPTAEGLTAEEDAANGQIRVSFRLTDPDNALSVHKVVVVNAEGVAVAERSFTADDLADSLFEGEIPLTDTGLTSQYTVRVTADLDLSSDGSSLETGKVLAEQTIEAAKRAVVSSGRAGMEQVEKGGSVDLFYAISDNVDADITALVVNNQQISAEAQQDGTWKVTAPAGDQAGSRTFILTQIVYDDETTLSADHELTAEVLRSAPAASGYEAEYVSGEGKTIFRFTLTDADSAFVSGKAQLVTPDGEVTAEKAVTQAGAQEFTFDTEQKTNYIFRVLLTWSKSQDGSIQAENETVLEKNVYIDQENASPNAIELKDVSEAALYYAGGSGQTEVEVLDITAGLPEDPESYFVQIEMDDMPDFYAGVREFRQDEKTGRVYAVVDQADLIQYAADGTKMAEYLVPLTYEDAEGKHPLMKSAQELFEQMAAEPSGSFQLTQDLDASGISTSAAAVAGTFTGKLDGNGYRIVNLPTSLFGTLNGATVTDLVIEDAQITTARNGILANSVRNNTRIENVFVINSTMSNSGVNQMGGFAGELYDSTISKSAAINVSLRSNTTLGGLVGQINAGSRIEDCYVTGTLQGLYDQTTLGARVGGITGWHAGGVITRCYTRVQISSPSPKGSGGLIGGPNTGSPQIDHSLSVSGGSGYRIAGFDVLGSVTEVYEYSGSDSTTNITGANSANVKETDAIYERSFYEDTLRFDGAVWNLDALSQGKLPTLKNTPSGENVYGIPAYEEVTANKAYRSEMDLAYANMAKLAPFADTAVWVASGNALPDTDRLLTGEIESILPLDESGSLVVGVSRDNPGEIRKIRVVFSDGTSEEYAVSYMNLAGDIVAVYTIEDTGLLYQFRHYVSDIDDALFSQMTALASGYDYLENLASLTAEEESRLYTDYYNENVKGSLEAVLAKLYSSQEEYPTYSDNAGVQALVRERIQNEEGLKRLLYAYNYYTKWYCIDFGGVRLSDLMFFSGELLSSDMNAKALTDKLLSATQAQRGVGQSHTLYSNVLQSYTGKELTAFLEDMAVKVAGYQNANDWFTDAFKGVLVEQPAYGVNKDAIRYRMWENLSNVRSDRRNMILSILSAPQEDMYLISVPSQFLIGSMNRYSDYLNKDGQERERIRATAQAYARKMGIFYGTSSTWLDNSVEQLNSVVDIQFDTRMHFPESAAAAAGRQDAGTTRDPVMKWVFEANSMLGAENGSAAFANGSIVVWMQDAALSSSDYTFYTFSHETAHNQDGRYFYGGAGRRSGTGGEAHADGNIAQDSVGSRDGSMVFNISRIDDITVETSSNFSYERIDSKEEIHSYYREMFETGYVLDYLAAQAFLQLTPRQQAAVAVQATHAEGQRNSISTVYARVSEAQIEAMELNDVGDLWDNKLSVRSGEVPQSIPTAYSGSYGYESFYMMNWYQSHNDNGSPDTHSFKRLGYEMLGVGGYENGYAIYMSGRATSDLDALRQITGDKDITWREYKMNRYSQVAEKLDQIPYFDAETVIAQFKAAFEADASNGNANQSVETKRMLYGLVKRVTGDFTEGTIYDSPDVISVTSAQELIDYVAQNPYGYYKLADDIDFSDIEAVNGSYISGRFTGILDGAGYQITGVHYPIFGNLQHAHVKNFTIESPVYKGEAQALLAVNANRVTVGDVKVVDADLQLPLVKTKTNGYYEYGETSVTIGESRIKTAEEFLAIGESPTSLKKKYVLEANLDFTQMNVSEYAVSGTFAGTIDGQGYTIQGLNAVLFQQVNGADIRNLTLEGTHLTTNNQKGALSNAIQNATIENIRVKNLTIDNNSNQVGGLAGTISGSNVSRISVLDASIKANNTTGGIAGQFDGNKLENCIVTGSIEATISHHLGGRAGGITGWAGGGIIVNCYTKVDITAVSRTGNGGLIGGPNSGSVVLQCSVSLSTGENANRISGWDVLNIASSAYELDTSNSHTNRSEATSSVVYSVTEQQAAEKSFYIDNLGWSEEIWNFDNLVSGGIPELR